MIPAFKMPEIRKPMDDQTTLSLFARMAACPSSVRKCTEGRLPSIDESFNCLKYFFPN